MSADSKENEDANASVVVSGPDFKSKWVSTALEEYLQQTYSASLLGNPEVQKDGTAIVRFVDNAQISATELVIKVTRQRHHSIAGNSVSVEIRKLVQGSPYGSVPPKPKPRTRGRSCSKESNFSATAQGGDDVDVPIEVGDEDIPKLEFIFSTFPRRREFQQAISGCSRLHWDKGTGILSITGKSSRETERQWHDTAESDAAKALEQYKVERIRVKEKMSFSSVVDIVESQNKTLGGLIKAIELPADNRVLVVGRKADAEAVYVATTELLASETKGNDGQLPTGPQCANLSGSNPLKAPTRPDHQKTAIQEPCEIHIDMTKRPIVDFVCSHHRRELKSSVGSCSKVGWNNDNGLLTLTPGHLSPEEAESWSQDVDEKVHDFLQQYTVKRIAIAKNEEWDTAYAMAEAEVDDTDEVTLVECQEERTIVVVGLKKEVNATYKSIKDKLSHVDCEDKKNPQIKSTAVERLTAPIFELMSRTKPYRKLKEDAKVTIEYNVGKLCVDISGQAEAVAAAKDTLNVLRDTIKPSHIEVESHVQQFLSSGSAIEQCNEILCDNGVIGRVLEVDDNGVKVIAMEGEIGKVRDQVTRCLCSSSIVVDDDDTRKYLDSQPCQQLFANVQDELNVQVTCVKSPSGNTTKIHITGQKKKTSESYSQIVDHLEKTVQMSEKRMLSSREMAEFLRQHKHGEIREIEAHLSMHQARITVQSRPPIIVLSCKKGGFNGLYEKVNALLIKCVGSASREFKKYGMRKFVKTCFPDIKEGIENKQKVVIKAEEKHSADVGKAEQRQSANYSKKAAGRGKPVFYSHHNSGSQQTGPKSPGSSHTVRLNKHRSTRNADKTIELYCGDICHHTVDAIVSSANEDLEFDGGLPAYLVKYGGISIAKECQEFLSQKRFKKKLVAGNAMSTTAGSLNSTNHVIHAVGPQWPKGAARNSSQEKSTGKLLRKAVNAALSKATSLGCSSVALPAISAGGFGCPSDFVAEHMVEAIDEFLGSKESKQMTDVHIVLLNRDQENIEAFQAKITAKFGKGSSPQPPKPMTAKSTSKLEVVVVQGDISTQTVDVIVSSTNVSLDLQAAQASKVLAQKAGPGLQRDCTEYVKSKGALNQGDVFETSGYNLQCKHVLHVVCPANRSGLADVVSRSLKMADNLRAQSIAFPALGTGGLGMNDTEAANGLFEGITAMSNPANIQKVIIVIHDSSKLSTYTNIQAAIYHIPSQGPSPQTPATPSVGACVELPNGITVVVEKGNIAIEQSDALVVPVGIVFSHVTKSGGQSFQQEWQTKHNSTVKSSTDFAEVSGAGQLKCKIVYVIAPANFNSHRSTSQNEDNISVVVEKVLTAANLAKLSSVSIPTIGTGNLGYSNNVSAGGIAKAIIAFSSSVIRPSIQTIKIVVFDDHRLTDFQQRIGQLCTVQHKQASGTSPSPRQPSPVKGFSYLSPGGSTPPHFVKSHNDTDDDDNEDDEDETVFSGELESVTISIVGETQYDCDKAMEAVVKKVDENCVEKDYGFEISKDVTDFVKEKAMEKQVHVKVTHQNQTTTVVLAGLKDDVNDAIHDISCHLSEKQKRQAKEREEKDICSRVQWLYEDKPETFLPYPSPVIVILETAYQGNEKTVDLNDPSYDRICAVNFNAIPMQELDKKTGHNRTVQRQEVQTTVPGIPKNWKQFASRDYECELVQLGFSHPDYKRVASRFLDSSKQTKYRQPDVPPYPHILSIQRVQNPRMYQMYLQEKEALQKKRESQLKATKAVLEMELFHGTKADVIEHVTSGGFNRSFAGTAVGKLLGAGVYFAKNSGYSIGYAVPDAKKRRKMILCKVLIGMWTKGNEQMITPPLIDGSVSKTDKYDSTVDDVTNPEIFAACFRDNMAYPEYVITFTHPGVKAN